MIKIFKEGKFSDILDPDLNNEDLKELQRKHLLYKFIIGTYKINSDGVIDVNTNDSNNVGVGVDVSHMNLIKLPVKFGEVNGFFSCYANQLTSLEGAPKKVIGNFFCFSNKLTSLEGAPKEVGGDFYCSNNLLTSLEGSPKEVGRDFHCSNNKLTSLEGSPKEVGRDFHIGNNSKKFTEEEVRAVCKVGRKVIV